MIYRATVRSIVTYAEKKSLNKQGDQGPAEHKDVASSIIDPQSHPSPYDVTSGLAMLPKVSVN